jgi:hypothetical protein
VLLLGCSTTPTFVTDGAGGATASASTVDGTGGNGSGAASSASTGAGGGAGGAAQGGAGGSGGACDQLMGLDVFCIPPGGSHVAQAAVSYGTGFPQGLPAMGAGQPGLGYIQQTEPFTCIAQAGDHGVATNNTAGGRICEVIFDNNVASTVTGTGTYTIIADSAASPGDYAFGFTSNSGTTVLTPNFYIRVR